MQVRILGAHNLEAQHTRHTCFLVDGVMAVDAGSLVTSLTHQEQANIKSVLVTHRHFDHVRDLPSLALSTLDLDGTTTVFGLPETLEAVTSRLMDGVLYPDFTQSLTKHGPKYQFNTINPGEEFNAVGYGIRSYEVPHAAPCVGYVISEPEGKTFAYCGDSGGGLLPFFHSPVRPEVLFIEVTFAERMEERAKITGHLTPNLLGNEISEAMRHGLEIPRIFIVHRNPDHEAEIKEELKLISAKLGVDIRLGQEDLLVDI